MMDDEETPAVVLDAGAVTTKTGAAGDEAPKLVFPSCVGYPPEMAHLQIKPGESWKGQYTVGLAAERKKDALLKWPIEEGVVKDWDAMEKLWTHAFAELMVTPAEEYGGVLLSDAPTNPKDGRERMTHIMFERFQLPNFYLAVQPLLAMYAAGKTTGVVVDAGEHVTHCVPMTEGYPIMFNAQRLPVAGLQMTKAVENMLKEKGITADHTAARKLKEEVCYVALDFSTESQKLEQNEKAYTLPDGTNVSLGVEQVRPCELMFKPEEQGLDQCGLHHVVNKVVRDCEYDQREELWNNVVVVGGSSLVKNMPKRLQMELGALAPSSSAVQVISPPERRVAAWMGGSILASLNTFNQMWITKEEYDESGPAIVHRKCI